MPARAGATSPSPGAACGSLVGRLAFALVSHPAMSEVPETQNEHELIAERKAKLARLREAGIEPFPHEFAGVVASQEVRDNHQGLEPGTETNVTYRVAGRLAARRGHGKAAFLDIVDRSGKMQVHARADLLGDESFEH